MSYLNKKLHIIYREVTGKQVLFIFVFFVLFVAGVLPFIQTLTTRVIGIAESPDTNFNFNLIQLYNIVDSYGSDGRRFYLLMRWTFDIIWPLTYTAFLLSTIGYLARGVDLKSGYKILYLPLLAVLFDLLENINASVIMALYPTRIDFFGYLLMGSSILKWIAISLSFVMVVLLLILKVIRIKKRGL